MLAATSVFVADFCWWTCSFLTHENSSANYEKRNVSLKMVKSILFREINNLIWFVLFLILTQMASSCKSLFFLLSHSPLRIFPRLMTVSSLVPNRLHYSSFHSFLFWIFLKHVWFKFIVIYGFLHPYLSQFFTALFSFRWKLLNENFNHFTGIPS